MLITEWATSALWVAAIPITHIVFPIAYFFYSLVLHIWLIPAFQVLKVLNYTFIYLPFKPVFYWMELGDPSVLTLVQTFPHFRFFIINMVHYLMVSAFFGIVVGVMTGLYLKVIQSVLTVDDVENNVRLQLVTESIKSSNKNKAMPFVEEYLKKINEPVAKQEPESKQLSQALNNSLTFQTIVNNIASSVRGGRANDMTLGQEYTYEDDDGYNYSSLPSPSISREDDVIQEIRSSRELRRASIVTEPSIKEEEEEEEEEEVKHEIEPMVESDNVSSSSTHRSDKSKKDDDVFSMRKRKVLDSTNETVDDKP